MKDAYSPAKIPYRKLTHIAHAFLLLDPKGDGSLSVDPGLIQPDLISRAHAAGVKVLISIGGAETAQGVAFAAVARDPDRRAAFVRNVRRFVEEHGYDGVDVDWEVPNAPDDTEPCVQLVRTLRAELPAPGFLLSMAIPSNPPGWGTGFDVPALAPMLDFVNVMTYDMHGPWSDHAGHNSPMLQSGDDPGREGSLASSADLFANTYGVPPEKINLGTAFYGYEFPGATALWGRCECRQGTRQVDYGTYVKQRVDKLGWKSYVDESAGAPYLLSQNGAGFVSYDDAKSTARKVKYALGTRGFGGVFMWQLAADYDGRSQDLLAAMYRAFRRFDSGASKRRAAAPAKSRALAPAKRQ